MSNCRKMSAERPAAANRRSPRPPTCCPRRSSPVISHRAPGVVPVTAPIPDLGLSLPSALDRAGSSRTPSKQMTVSPARTPRSPVGSAGYKRLPKAPNGADPPRPMSCFARNQASISSRQLPAYAIDYGPKGTPTSSRSDINARPHRPSPRKSTVETKVTPAQGVAAILSQLNRECRRCGPAKDRRNLVSLTKSRWAQETLLASDLPG